jgi:hypothetical protein
MVDPKLVCAAIVVWTGAAAAQGGSITATELVELHGSSPFADDRFGRDILLDGDTALVMWGQFTSSFAVECLVHTNGAWTHPPSPGFAANGYTMSFAGDLHLEGFPAVAKVGVWRRSNSNWSQSWLVAPAIGQPPEAFGASTDIDGSTVVVSNYQHTHTFSQEGAIYVYEDTGSQLVLRQSIFGGAAGTQLGVQVRVSGDDMLAYYHTAQFTFGIQAFRRIAGQWTPTQSNLAPSYAHNGGFELDRGLAVARITGGGFVVLANPGNGWFVDSVVVTAPSFTGAYDFEIDDGVIAASDPSADFAANDAGAAYLFARNDGWRLQATVTASDAHADDYFGYGIALQGDRLMVGAPDDDDIDDNAGGVYEYALAHSPARVHCVPEQASLGCVAHIGFSGTASASSGQPFLLSASNVLGQRNGALVYGTNGRAFTPYPGGVRCIAPPRRVTARQTSGGAANTCSGALAFDFNAWIASGSDPLLQVGQVVEAQWIYRDPFGPSALASSEAVEFAIAP